jgi:4-hydroxybutyryl-CoA dehydratase / vinylacetyl-CoA-Delta-isomerase
MFGERNNNIVEDSIIRPSINAVAKTYEMAHSPEYEDIMTATSHLSGNKINRCAHFVSQSPSFFTTAVKRMK